VKQRLGITSEGLADAMGVGVSRAWQYVGTRERCGVRRERS
jgi:hypothetical protein